MYAPCVHFKLRVLLETNMEEKKAYVISYDMAEGGDYDRLFAHIKEYKYWAHITESTWAVLSTQSAAEIRDKMLHFLPKGSKLFVVQSANVAAWSNVICSNEWLKKNI